MHPAGPRGETISVTVNYLTNMYREQDRIVITDDFLSKRFTVLVVVVSLELYFEFLAT